MTDTRALAQQFGDKNMTDLRQQIVTEIMSLVRQQPKKMEPRPTIEELEKILNSECTDDIQIEPDGSVSVRPTVTTVGAVADKVVVLVQSALSAARNEALEDLQWREDEYGREGRGSVMSKCTHDIGDKILAGQRQCQLCLAADLATAERLLKAVRQRHHAKMDNEIDAFLARDKDRHALQGDCPDETWAALKRMAKDENDALLECERLRQRLALATRLLRRAVTELNHHVCYEDAETMEFLNPKKEG